jgi:hypothetical protein
MIITLFLGYIGKAEVKRSFCRFALALPSRIGIIPLDLRSSSR